MEGCRKWTAVSSLLLLSASPHLEELILATVSVRVLTGNRWCIPVEESLMKETFGGVGAGLREPAGNGYTFQNQQQQKECHLP